jgi:hypothetical protein
MSKVTARASDRSPCYIRRRHCRNQQGDLEKRSFRCRIHDPSVPRRYILLVVVNIIFCFHILLPYSLLFHSPRLSHCTLPPLPPLFVSVPTRTTESTDPGCHAPVLKRQGVKETGRRVGQNLSLSRSQKQKRE